MNRETPNNLGGTVVLVLPSPPTDVERHEMAKIEAVIKNPDKLAAFFALLPDTTLTSEYNRRRGRLRKTYTGGKVWSKHNPTVRNCRCLECTTKRKGMTA